ncbi:MAG: DUF3067 family protein [Cyanobacteria bacterium P01_G01_bin.54]
MTGLELCQLIRHKWGYAYDVQLRKVKDTLYFQVMWRYLEQVSFPLSEVEYLEHLNAIASYLEVWGCVEQVQQQIEQTSKRPRLGHAVSFPLDLGDRTSEWIL